jgi:hypothetical protein
MTTAYFDAGIDFKTLGVECSRLRMLHEKVSAEGWPKDVQEAWVVLTAMAASIEKCYSGAEKILKNLIHELDGAVPSSQDWHRQLIERAAAAGPHGRPPILDAQLAAVFHDLRSFRHRERNSYVAQLDPAIVLAKAAVATMAIQSFGEANSQQCESEAVTDIKTDVPK